MKNQLGFQADFYLELIEKLLTSNMAIRWLP
jgi:hypothetical protein